MIYIFLKYSVGKIKINGGRAKNNFKNYLSNLNS
jgi:hypothetical protein